MNSLSTILLKVPRDNQSTPEATKTFLSALLGINQRSFLDKLFKKGGVKLALEIVSSNQQIYFCITSSSEIMSFVETQIQSNYPLVTIQKATDPLQNCKLEVESLTLAKGSYYPITTYEMFQEGDGLSNLLSVLSKCETDEIAFVQFAIESTDSSWQSKGMNYADFGSKNDDGTYSPRSDKNVIIDKISYPGFKTSIRLASNTKRILNEMISTFGIYTRSGANSFKKKSGLFTKKDNFENLLKREVTDSHVLNIIELATLWHLPNEKVKVSTIAWSNQVLSEAPETLPNALSASEDDKKTINFFARTFFKNKEVIYGIKDNDRRRHVWVIGKTGTGKSTLIANMAIDDLKKDKGMAIIDPHGDLCEILLDFVPKRRINDVVYFNPSDKNYPISINPLEVRNKEEAELVVSGLMAIFTKVWANVWSARMEYILRNSFLTLAEVPNSTLIDVLRLLSEQSYRNRVVEKLQDQALIHFWRNEFDKMPPNLQKEAIAPIQNKVGQFVTSPLIRRVIGNPKSSVSLESVMNEGKILLANLSQGRLGEDNSALLGAMLITKLQLVAMRRVEIDEDKRKDFYLYVDEFQNFATTSFIKILSEARKYRLSVLLANQYMAQIPDDVQKAILGNAGTITCFALGATDADILHREFAEVFSQNDLVNLNKYQIATKMMINGETSRPFVAQTLPLPISKNQNRTKVIEISRQRWARKIQES